jgi:hypothetical protein
MQQKNTITDPILSIRKTLTLGASLLIIVLATHSARAGDMNKDLAQTIETLDEQVASLPTESGAGKSTNSPAFVLEKFQGKLWRAMALDPGPVTLVPPAQVPKELFANELNVELSKLLDDVGHLNVPKSAQADYDKYVSAARQILAFRQHRQFPQARAIAKRGTLDDAFQSLITKFPHESESGTKIDLSPLKATVSNLKSQLSAPSPKDAQKKDLFAHGNQFVWYAIAAVLGFFFGIAGYRMNPDFFHKFLSSSDSIVPTATTHSVDTKLDYTRWLKEFEEILTRLKTSQLTHERRIEDLVQTSEKMSQQALSLYADARIKNEANLEHRMSTLLRAVHHSMDQGHKLQSGDRIQVNVMLEHCLRLCDGIESGSIQLNRAEMHNLEHSA